jgi:hypothetical protein
MPQGVIAALHLGGGAAQSIGRPAECIITAAGQIIRPDLRLCLFTCVRRHGFCRACIIHIP